MDKEYFKVKDLAEELGMSISNLNISISRGHAGEVTKASEGETSDYLLTLDNVLLYLRWSQLNGRSSKRNLMTAIAKYKKLKEEQEVVN